jgi:hypothetical protein
MVLPAVLLLGVAAVLAAFSIPTTIGRQATATRGVATYADALHSNAIPPAPPKLGVEIKDTALVRDTFRSRATTRERR